MEKQDYPIGHVLEHGGEKFIVVEDSGSDKGCEECVFRDPNICPRITYCTRHTRSDKTYVHLERFEDKSKSTNP